MTKTKQSVEAWCEYEKGFRQSMKEDEIELTAPFDFFVKKEIERAWWAGREYGKEEARWKVSDQIQKVAESNFKNGVAAVEEKVDQKAAPISFYAARALSKIWEFVKDAVGDTMVVSCQLLDNDFHQLTNPIVIVDIAKGSSRFSILMRYKNYSGKYSIELPSGECEDVDAASFLRHLLSGTVFQYKQYVDAANGVYAPHTKTTIDPEIDKSPLITEGGAI